MPSRVNVFWFSTNEKTVRLFQSVVLTLTGTKSVGSVMDRYCSTFNSRRNVLKSGTSFPPDL